MFEWELKLNKKDNCGQDILKTMHPYVRFLKTHLGYGNYTLIFGKAIASIK